MHVRPRIVVDTNALVSRLLLPDSIPGRAVRRAVDEGLLLVSNETLAELADVFCRAKFDPYVSIADRQRFIVQLGRIVEVVPIVRQMRACRDPDDDKFLSLAVNGEATLIITGDRDLLDLSPFMGIPIISPAEYLAGFATPT
ncbi:MAG: putative toxin-antitoxin system toxin component, PIN family [Rhodospirillales bacterium]